MMWKELIYICLLSVGIAFIEIHFFPEAKYLKNLTTVYSLLGFVISLLLVFRTNTAYERWWEGRKMWGSIVNDTRNLSLKLQALTLNDDQKALFLNLLISYPQAVKNQLRNISAKPLEIQALFRKEIEVLQKGAQINPEQWSAIQRDLDGLVNSLGACERIKNTPIPFSYSLFIKKFIFIYVITMPLAFVPLFGYFASFISTFVFYALVSMELLAEEIEDPFGSDTNDLPTDQICINIEKNCRELLK